MQTSANALAAFVRRYTVRKLLADMRDSGHPITERAIYHWCSGRRLPRPQYALMIVALSDGALSLQDMYKGQGRERHRSG